MPVSSEDSLELKLKVKKTKPTWEAWFLPIRIGQEEESSTIEKIPVSNPFLFILSKSSDKQQSYDLKAFSPSNELPCIHASVIFLHVSFLNANWWSKHYSHYLGSREWLVMTNHTWLNGTENEARYMTCNASENRILTFFALRQSIASRSLR